LTDAPPKPALRIAYVINSLEGGGAALPVPAVTGVMRDAGATVQLFALARADGRAIGPIAKAGLGWSAFEGARSDQIGAGRWLLEELKRFRPTHIWTSLTRATVLGQFAGALLRRPVISWQHNAFLKPANLRLLRATRGMTRLWLADSETVAELTRERLDLTANRLMVWPLFQARPDAPQASSWREGETFRFGSLGRLHPNKGYDILVEALARVEAMRSSGWPEFEVVIGGQGDELERLTAQARALNVRSFRLAGFQGDPQGFLAGLHAYLQPSRAEGLCIAAHEAMQAGLPVVAADVGEMPRSVRPGETGYVTPSGDVAALADAIAALLADPQRAYAMGRAGRALVLDRFSSHRFQDAGHAVIARLAVDPRPRIVD
jgi:glycosyltransferase involved in cell wall biosynthesis